MCVYVPDNASMSWQRLQFLNSLNSLNRGNSCGFVSESVLGLFNCGHGDSVDWS